MSKLVQILSKRPCLKNCGIFSRNFCSNPVQSRETLLDASLSKPLPSFPTPKYADVGDHSYETKVTTLKNGLRVATENKFGQFTTVGVLVDSGSRYENNFPGGINHFLEKLAFSSTVKFKNRDAILQKLESHGGICDCQVSRDTLIFAISAECSGLNEVVDILSEVSLKPLITESEVNDARTAIKFELETLEMDPNPEPLLVEMIHKAAFADNTLGLPKICPSENVSTMSLEHINSYLSNYHTPERMVVAGVGIDHDALVKVVEEKFCGVKPTWEGSKSGGGALMDTSIAQYTGGIETRVKDLSDVSLGPTPIPELAHCVIGLQGVPHNDPDFIPFCVLNMIMGGGGSFSAGGPGKGMYSRLYLNVLNRYHWMYNSTAFNHSYNDTGLFCIHAAAHPSKLKDLVNVITGELVNTGENISDVELSRAKTQLQSMLLMNLESRPIIFEDVGRQVLATGKREPATHYFEEIGKITEKDIKRVSSRMLNSRPSIAALGDLAQLPSEEDIREALSSNSGKLARRFNLFSR